MTTPEQNLPAWPERDPIHHAPGAVEVGGYEYDSCPTCHAYERARYLAAMARLRVAVEALSEIADNPGRENIFAREAQDALAAIGDLPPPLEA
jgi:hypothetical protein